MKLILGTANFGTPYGIANDPKKLTLKEINKILRLSKNKVKFLDTASSYIDSEKIIGSNTNKKNFKIITKLPKVGNKISLIESYVLKSLKNLKCRQLYAVMVHSVTDLSSRNLIKILASLNRLKKQKKIKKIGISVYTENNLLKICEYYFLKFMSQYHFMNNLDNIMISLKQNYNSPIIFKKYIDQFNKKDFKLKEKELSKFILSKKNRIYADNSTKKSKVVLFY